MRYGIRQPKRRVNVHARRTASRVEVSVSDTGEGIRAEDLPHIFESFYRGEKSRSRSTAVQGWACDLTRNVQAHGGEIKVQSEAGRGSQFTFTLHNKTLSPT
ncbi:sensor histidine kinase [Candidatus Villigracilis affinis]|uniref:sensor histidine kinase n=1 Tax=Candidatus Villigracilis affinis TaxID=3140682 RepID=UPI002A1F0FC5|nr:sensor histidine kinase [Anaerolineales bacterium]